MTIYQFRLLNENDQADLIYNNGVYIGKRYRDNFFQILFQVEGFYVEVSYHRYRVHISHISCYKSVSVTNEYLDSIEIHDVVNSPGF
jgi:hypothetical protein